LTIESTIEEIVVIEDAPSDVMFETGIGTRAAGDADDAFEIEGLACD